MKRSFAYLILALLLSLLLCACGDTAGRGNVTASPWPDLTVPPMPTPTPELSVSPMPDFSMNNDTTGSDTGADSANDADDNNATGMSTSSPVPTDNTR